MSLRLKVLYTGAKIYWRIFQPVTFGVKIMLIREETVLLVKHSYEKGWHLPGGGVKRHESVETAVRREAREELGAEMDELHLFGVYTNDSQYKNDHVVVFVSHKFTLGPADKAEIRAVQKFPLRQLPPDVSRGTRHRIEEYLAGRPKAEVGIW